MGSSLTAATCFLAYGASAVYLFKRFRLGSLAQQHSRLPAIGLAGLAIVSHGLLLRTELVTPEGLLLGFSQILSLLIWFIAICLTLAMLIRPVGNLGIISYPIAAFSALFTTVSEPAVSQISWQLALHIFTSALAYALLILAVLQALLLRWQEHALKSHHPAGMVRALPPLLLMEEMLFQLIFTGFSLLTLSLLSGLFFVDNLFAQHLAHKTILSICAWLIFGGLLWGHWQYGWRANRAVRWTLAGGVILILAYFGSKLILEIILNRNWG